jgi:hypothetical protein
MSGAYLEAGYFPAKTGTSHAGHYEVVECSVHQKGTRRSREVSPSTLRTSLNSFRLSLLSSLLQLTHNYQLRLQSRNASAAAHLGAAAHQDLETAISTAVKHHQEEEIQLIKESLAKAIHIFTSNPY